MPAPESFVEINEPRLSTPWQRILARLRNPQSTWGHPVVAPVVVVQDLSYAALAPGVVRRAVSQTSPAVVGRRSVFVLRALSDPIAVQLVQVTAAVSWAVLENEDVPALANEADVSGVIYTRGSPSASAQIGDVASASITFSTATQAAVSGFDLNEIAPRSLGLDLEQGQTLFLAGTADNTAVPFLVAWAESQT